MIWTNEDDAAALAAAFRPPRVGEVATLCGSPEQRMTITDVIDPTNVLCAWHAEGTLHRARLPLAALVRESDKAAPVLTTSLGDLLAQQQIADLAARAEKAEGWIGMANAQIEAILDLAWKEGAPRRQDPVAAVLWLIARCETLKREGNEQIERLKSQIERGASDR